MPNLLEETIKVLKEHGKSPTDILYVMDIYNSVSWNYFAERANKEYDNGYGGVEVNDRLKVVGENFWLEREEYDGSEWWSYRTTPEKPEGIHSIRFKIFEHVEEE